MCDKQVDERYREFAKRLLPDIESDDNTLRSILEAIDEEPSGIKNAGGWLLEKLTRLKLGHARSPGLDLFEALEMLSLGIAGKLYGKPFRLFRRRIFVWVSLISTHYCIAPTNNIRP